MELICGSFDQSNDFGCNNHHVSEIDDAVYEILMRIDPCNLFKCVLVSKDWLSMIVSPSFRKMYLNKWKDSTSIVLGMLILDTWNSWRPRGAQKHPSYTVTQPGLELLATSSVGRNMINWNLARAGGIRNSMPRGLVGSKSLEGCQNVIRNSMPLVGSKSLNGGRNVIVRNSMPLVVSKSFNGGQYVIGNSMPLVVSKSLEGIIRNSMPLAGSKSMNIRNSMPTGFFLSKSPKGDLILSCGILPDTFYVCKSNFGGPLVELPRPLMHYKRYMANILSDDDDDSKYRVILACAGVSHDDGKLPIQTYCSWTGKWESSTLSCPMSLILRTLNMVDSGIVTCGGTGGGVIYWDANINLERDCLAAWDINGGSVSEIPKPPKHTESFKYLSFNTTYGVAPQPQGSLLAATCCYEAHRGQNIWESKWFTINIWALSDVDKKGWYLLHSVRHASIWANNLALLNSFFEARPSDKGFTFVSFFPGKSDSIFVGLGRHLFVYHFQTGKLEYINILKHGLGFKGFCNSDKNHALTMLDSGIWPSSPLSLQLPCCS